MRTLVVHGGGARDDAQETELCQFRNQRVGHAVCKIFLVRISRKVLQRQNGNRVNGDHTTSKNMSTDSGKIKRKGTGDECGKSEGKNPCAPPAKRRRAPVYDTWLCSK
jgi:hypothetical protein